VSDRLFALIVLLAAIAYIVAAADIPTGFLVDPVGPKMFPRLVGGVAALCALLILIKPDEDPKWPDGLTWLRLFIAFAVLVAYAYTLKPLGFLIPTAIAAGVLSYQIRARAMPALFTGIALSGGLFVIFKYVLDLGLFAIPRDWMG